MFSHLPHGVSGVQQRFSQIRASFGVPEAKLQSFIYKMDKEKDQDDPLRIHPPVELILNEAEIKIKDPKTNHYIIGPHGKEETKKILKDPPLLVFDHKTRSVRKVNPSDGLFYYTCEKPELGRTSGVRGRKRSIRFIIVITIYSETYDELMLTLEGVYHNLDEFKTRGICNEDIACVIIYDGILKMDESMKELFENEDRMKGIPFSRTMKRRAELFQQNAEGYPINSCYMYQMNMRPADSENKKNVNFLTCFFGAKLQNAGKLSSHMWFFRGFCEMFQPYYCCLLDCGTIPSKLSIYKVFQALEGDEQIGGVCGYMGLQPEKMVDASGKRADHQFYPNYDCKFLLKFFCIQKCQKFEYSISHVLDKAFESIFGFIHVLPGAYSSYKWDALRRHKTIINQDKEE